MHHRKISELSASARSPIPATTASVSSSPHPADRHVGRQIAIARAQNNLSQPKLADRIGISYQQLQKYESGKNRVSASTLYAIATTLNVPVARFFAGLPGNVSAADQPHPYPQDDRIAFLASAEGRRLIDGLMRLRPSVRTRIFSLIVTLGEKRAAPSERQRR